MEEFRAECVFLQRRRRLRARISKSSQMIDTAQRAESSTRANARPRANSRRLINSPWTMAAQLVQLHIAAMDAA
jgi:hypothetical protein